MAKLYKTAAFIALIAAALYIADQYFSGGICKSNTSLDGKTVIITGGNTGIGKETAIDLAARGAKVIIGCRSRERGEKALVDIKKESGSNDVYLQLLDLSSFRSVRAFAKRIVDSEKRLDILINNAGIFLAPFKITEDGFESHFQVNHLGHFLLTQLLIDLLKKSAPSRIINVSSIAHQGATVEIFDNVGNETLYSGLEAYSLSKLANIVYAKELAKRYIGSNVTAYSLHPGVVETEVSRNLFNRYPILKKVAYVLTPAMRILVKNSKEGAQTTICTAVEEGLEKHSGEYFSDCAVAPSSALSNDKHFAEKLWDYSIKATKLDL